MKRHPLMPDDTPDYMLPAWIGCIRFALLEDNIRADFEKDTGMRYTPPRNVIEKMIDDSTGYNDDYIEEFIRWINVNICGPLGEVE